MGLRVKKYIDPVRRLTSLLHALQERFLEAHGA